MADEQQTEPVEQVVEQPTEVVTPEPEKVTENVTPPIQPLEAGTPTEVQPYTPNFKFTVHKKEHEIDPLFRGVIKDADTEKKVKELYQKAYGLDIVKSAYDRDSAELGKLREKTKTIESTLGEIREDYTRGDMDSVFKKLGLQEEKVLQWLVAKAQYNELPTDQRDMLDKRRLAEERAYALEKQQSQVQQSYESLQTQVKRMELERVLEKSEVKSFAEAFDAKAGQPGAFWNAVAEHGEMVAVTRKIDLTPEQAVNDVMKRYGMFYSQPTGQQPTQPRVIPTQQTKPPTIPNVSGSSHSPVDKGPKSISDLRKLAAQA